ncbi:MAG: hypothetical protein ACI9C1_001215 [Candidatus Aldehydirespiratoraceae bacterium]
MTGLTGLCRDHSFERAKDICRRCGREHCELCLVYPFGPKKALCKKCAMVAGGVRAHGSRLEMHKREVKHRVKAFAERATRESGAGEAPNRSMPADPVLNDPLAPTEADLERVPATIPDHGANVARVPSESFNERSPAPPPPPLGSGPADGVAPPIDWSQPFG